MNLTNRIYFKINSMRVVWYSQKISIWVFSWVSKLRIIWVSQDVFKRLLAKKITRAIDPAYFLSLSDYFLK